MKFLLVSGFVLCLTVLQDIALQEPFWWAEGLHAEAAIQVCILHIMLL